MRPSSSLAAVLLACLQPLQALVVQTSPPQNNSNEIVKTNSTAAIQNNKEAGNTLTELKDGDNHRWRLSPVTSNDTIPTSSVRTTEEDEVITSRGNLTNLSIKTQLSASAGLPNNPLIGNNGCKIPNVEKYALEVEKGLYWHVGDKIDMYGDQFCETHNPDTWTFVWMHTRYHPPARGGGPVYFILDHDCRIHTIWPTPDADTRDGSDCHDPWHAKVDGLPLPFTGLKLDHDYLYWNHFSIWYGDVRYVSEKSLGSHCRYIDKINAGGWWGKKASPHPYACGVIFNVDGEIGPGFHDGPANNGWGP